MSKNIKGYCSSCYNKSTHKLIEQNYLRRNIYKCLSCGKKTVICRICNNFANTSNEDKLIGWDDELCAEHNGLVNFKMINKNFNQLEDFYESENFKIKKIKNGKGRKIIFINGFLAGNSDKIDDWKSELVKIYPSNPLYYIIWDGNINIGFGELSLIARNAFKVAENTGVLGKAVLATSLGLSSAYSSWSVASVKSYKIGVLLANILTRSKDEYILCGHSLGARVIYYALESLAIKDEKIIDTVHLLGGAVGSDKESWEKAKGAVRKKIYNYKSDNDDILALMYKLGTFFTSSPIGRNSIDVRGIKNIDVSDIVDGHTKYKENFAKFAKI